MPRPVSDPNIIATELHRVYPDVVRVSLSLNDLRALIDNLPDSKFSKSKFDENTLNHILWTWMRIADEKMMVGDVS